MNKNYWRESEKPNNNQALLAQTSKKSGNNSRGGFRGRGRRRNSRGGYGKGGQNQDQEKGSEDHYDNMQRNSNGWRRGKRKSDKKRIKCFNCNRIGHFSTECKATPNNSDYRDN